MKNFILEFLAFACIISSILVITSRNPVIAVIYLISVFINAACYLLILGIGFIGLTYLLLYVGAITILFLFVIMSINIKLTDIMEAGTQYTQNIPLALSIGIFFIYEVLSILPYSVLSLGSYLGYNVPLLNYPIKAFKWINDQIFQPNSYISFNNVKTQLDLPILRSEKDLSLLSSVDNKFLELERNLDKENFSQIWISENKSPITGMIEMKSKETNLWELINNLSQGQGHTLNNYFIPMIHNKTTNFSSAYNETIDGIFSNIIQLSSLGQELYTHGISWLIICGTILLLSLLCPTIITRSPHSFPNTQPNSSN